MSPPIIHRSRSPFKFRHETKKGKPSYGKYPSMIFASMSGLGRLLDLAGLITARHQAKIEVNIAGLPEAFRIIDGGS